jgi:hypothetical protein
MFASHLKTSAQKNGNQNNWAYKVLQWQITENELESQSMHSNTVHTAFSFVHGGQPFFMRVEVSGRLESRRHQLKHRIRTLKFPTNTQSAGCATTLINFNGRHKFTTPLDGLVAGLELAMEHENIIAPIERKNVQQPIFYEDDPPAPAPPPSIEPRMDAQHLLEEQEDPTAPTMENISSLGSWLMARPGAPLGPVSDLGLFNHPPMGRFETVHTPPPQSQHQKEAVPVIDVDIEGQNSNIVRPQTESEHAEAKPTTVVTRPNGPRVSVDQVDLGIVVYLMRLWMMQTLATLLGYGGDKSG